MQSIRHLCDRCGKPIDEVTMVDPATGESVAVPVVISLVVGVPPGVANAEQLEIATLPIPSSLVAIAAQALPRAEWCVPCFISDHGLEADWTGRHAEVARKQAVADAVAAETERQEALRLATEARITAERQAILDAPQPPAAVEDTLASAPAAVVGGKGNP